MEDKELENIFNQILQDVEHCTMLEMHPREKLPKRKLTPDTEESANRIITSIFMEIKISLKLQTRSMQWERQLQ